MQSLMVLSPFRTGIMTETKGPILFSILGFTPVSQITTQ